MELVHQIFGEAAATISWWQMAARAAVIVLYAIALLRLGARRVQGNDTAMDMIVAVIVGSALSRAMTGSADLLPTLAATALLFAIHSFVASVAVRSGWFSKIVKGRETKLIENGLVDWPRARRALMGRNDIEQELRLHGVIDPEAVEAAYLERNGRISVILKKR